MYVVNGSAIRVAIQTQGCDRLLQSRAMREVSSSSYFWFRFRPLTSTRSLLVLLLS